MLKNIKSIIINVFKNYYLVVILKKYYYSEIKCFKKIIMYLDFFCNTTFNYVRNRNIKKIKALVFIK